LYERGDVSGIKANYLPRVNRILLAFDAATEPGELDLPGFGFHPLRGDRKDFYSIRVSGNWRIVFRFGNEPEDVDLVDYH
jgi:proteic killer suppression protein